MADSTNAVVTKLPFEKPLAELESIVQKHDQRVEKGAPVPVILITYATTEDAVRKALAAVGRDRVISGTPQVIRIEKN